MILLRTSDGRGQVVTGGRVIIPEFQTIENDTVVSSCIAQGDAESWYCLDAKDKNAYVNLLSLSSDVSASIYNRYGELIGMNDLHDVDYEVLRAKMQDQEAAAPQEEDSTPMNEFFVRVRRSEAAPPSVAEVSYFMVQSRDVGYYEETGYLAVLGDEGIVPTPRPTGAVSDDEKDKIVNCVDINGNPVEMTKSSITFLPAVYYRDEKEIKELVRYSQLHYSTENAFNERIDAIIARLTTNIRESRNQLLDKAVPDGE